MTAVVGAEMGALVGEVGDALAPTAEGRATGAMVGAAIAEPDALGAGVGDDATGVDVGGVDASALANGAGDVGATAPSVAGATEATVGDVSVLGRAAPPEHAISVTNTMAMLAGAR